MFKDAVRVQDMLTEEIFAADWLLERVTATEVWLKTKWVAENVLVPANSFLGQVIEDNWRGQETETTKIFRQYGYPIGITAGEVPQMFCLIKRPINFGVYDQLLKMQMEIIDTKPVDYCEAIEAWRPIYAKYLEERK